MGSSCSKAASKDAVVGGDTAEKSEVTRRPSSAHQPELWGNSFFSGGGSRRCRGGGGFRRSGRNGGFDDGGSLWDFGLDGVGGGFGGGGGDF